MKYTVNNISISYNAEGTKAYGEDVVLLRQALDLTAQKPWGNEGYTVEKLFNDDIEYRLFERSVAELLYSCWRKAGLLVPADFQLDQYHALIKDRVQHLAAVDQTKLLSVDDFPLGIERIEKRISEISGVALRAHNPYDEQRVFHFRVIRPESRDNNPLHRDVWLEDYESCINLYIPIAASNENSSLIIFPGSHLWPESRIERTTKGALIDGVKFNVPAVTNIKGEYVVKRPDPKPNQVLVFSPYIIHGGSVNFNSDKTRISIELRLWKV
ncbi:phytanoyl-CoA dioxygenase family protein [Chryseosolibacter indicus]|uniref:Phytanoyl-CoA dioxygenase n=1 Tax=Chryseosolibacter indicus TaxID=2782351 RepID=A0ABS5VN22_9BACT|nr:phytanoyl-CoA dioxygenase family protein [Chryseosolibacter indicus]MBT1702771.1 hypothetical protein [Chryseosolibacter indicus]